MIPIFYVQSCLIDLNISKYVTVLCPTCLTMKWRQFILIKPDIVHKIEDVGNTQLRCETMFNESVCGWTGHLYHLLSHSSIIWLEEKVAEWMNKKGIQNTVATCAHPSSEEISRALADCDKMRHLVHETDKLEGTRNVDKFLEEQQTKLWKRMI